MSRCCTLHKYWSISWFLITVHCDFYCSIVRLFSSDRKRVENALENCRLPYSRVNTLHLLILMFLGVHDSTALVCKAKDTKKTLLHSSFRLLPICCYWILFFFRPRMSHSAPRVEKKAQRCGSSSLNATSQKGRKTDNLYTLDPIMALPPVSGEGFTARDLRR